ncbi:hypothetical protein C9446_07940 [Providencia heimbachae]|uniref:MASE1 domain-containing protein n=1 Tax=Providencia heimbachae TaxID=333962 RepID=UPI0010BE9B5A|nr:MASE1 domain-containing protein [Providencia heimbachae]QCJ69789.1 hypothetical protein C9446_07940 [Providencia heimbachae]
MKTSLLSRYSSLVAIIGWLLLYYVTGEISDLLTPAGSEISVVWFPAGVATTAFLCMHKRHWLLLLIGFITLNLILDGFEREDVFLSLLYSALAMISCIAIAWIVRRYARNGDDLQIILLWFSTTIIVSFADAALFSIFMYWLNNLPIKDIFWDGVVADVTGNIFATTVIMGLINSRLKISKVSKISLMWGGIIFVLLIISTILIFNDSAIQLYRTYFNYQRNFANLSLLCIPVLLAVFLSLLWGNRGSSIALLILATITIYYTHSQLGPFYLRGLYQHESLWLIQGYLTVISLLMVFLRVVRKSTHQIDEQQGAYQQQHLVYQLNLSNGDIEWGNQEDILPKVEITGLSNSKQLMQSVHPDDYEKMYQHWHSSQNYASLPTMTFRFIDSNGDCWNIEDRGSVIFGDSDPIMVVGNWFISSDVSWNLNKNRDK